MENNKFLNPPYLGKWKSEVIKASDMWDTNSPTEILSHISENLNLLEVKETEVYLRIGESEGLHFVKLMIELKNYQQAMLIGKNFNNTEFDTEINFDIVNDQFWFYLKWF